MTLILDIPGVQLTDTSIPFHYRDIIANSGTLDIFDARENERSWPKQGDPTEGVETWKSLIGDTPNAASFAGTVGWSNGFAMNDAADVITLPSTFKLAANGKGIFIFWTKVGVQTATTGNGAIAHVATASNPSQFICFLDHEATESAAYLKFYTPNAGTEVILDTLNNLPASRLAQIAISFEPEAGGYRVKSFLNGLRKTNDLLGSLAAMPQPAATMRFGGTLNVATQPYIGTHLRALIDDLSNTTPETLVALDYATHAARLA